MMAYSEDHIALAAEYALGTLDAQERDQVEALMASDPDFALVVDAWVRQFSVLNQMVGAVEPRAEVWDRIKAAVAASQPDVSQPKLSLTPSDALDLIAAASTDAPSPPPGVSADTVAKPAAGNVIQFERQVRRWRGIATGASALAAGLVAFVAVQAYRPELLPEGVRPKAPVQVAEAPARPAKNALMAGGQYVALLQKDGTSPAFILTVDSGSKTFTVRKVDASNEPGHSYELWLVSDKLQKPRSLGVIGGKDFTVRPELASYDPDMVSKATYAVTVEPEGGSPTGQATGPIVFSGKLIETVPAAK